MMCPVTLQFCILYPSVFIFYSLLLKLPTFTDPIFYMRVINVYNLIRLFSSIRVSSMSVVLMNDQYIVDVVAVEFF